MEPRIPNPSEFGRLVSLLRLTVSGTVPMLGFHCRWCHMLLHQTYRNDIQAPSLGVACENCDHGWGQQPEMVRDYRGLL